MTEQEIEETCDNLSSAIGAAASEFNCDREDDKATAREYAALDRLRQFALSALRRGQEPVAWRLRIGDSDIWGYIDNERDADFYGRQSGLRYIKEPLFAAPAWTPVEQPLWLWKNGDHYWAFDNLYPCEHPDGDPLTLGEPAARAIFKPSFPRIPR